MVRVRLASVILVAFAIAPGACAMFQPRLGWTKALLETRDRAVAEEFAATFGAELLQQYEDFAIFYIPDGAMAQFAETARSRQIGFLAKPQYDTVETARLLIDVRKGIPPELAPSERITGYPSGTKGLYLLQYMAPVLLAWQSEVRALGIDLVVYINYNAFIVAATPEEISRATDLPFVQWIDFFHPFLKSFGPSPRAGVWRYSVNLANTRGWEAAVDEIRQFAVSVSPPERAGGAHQPVRRHCLRRTDDDPRVIFKGLRAKG